MLDAGAAVPDRAAVVGTLDVGCTHPLVICGLCGRCHADLTLQPDDGSGLGGGGGGSGAAELSMVHALPQLLTTPGHAERTAAAHVKRLVRGGGPLTQLRMRPPR